MFGYMVYPKTLVVTWHFQWCYIPEDCSLNIQMSWMQQQKCVCWI